MKTFNKAPSSVKQYGYDDLNYQFFNHSNWKGLCDNKNYIGVDQETFEECNNVYIDENALLSSRPAIKRDKHFDKLLTVDKVTYQISNAYPFTDELIVLEYKKDNQKYLKFVNSNYSENVQFYIGIDNYKLVDEDNKIFIFADNVFAYYDKSDNIIYSDNSNDPDNKQQALDKIYVPTTTQYDGSKYVDLESPNEFTAAATTVYHYVNYTSLPDELNGKTVTIKIGNSDPVTVSNFNKEAYFKVLCSEKFTINNTNRLPDAYYSAYSAAKYPLLFIADNGNMILCTCKVHDNKSGSSDYKDYTWTISWSTTGNSFTTLVTFPGENEQNTLIGLPHLISDGSAIIYRKGTGLYKLELSSTAVESPLVTNLPLVNTDFSGWYSIDSADNDNYCFTYETESGNITNVTTAYTSRYIQCNTVSHLIFPEWVICNLPEGFKIGINDTSKIKLANNLYLNISYTNVYIDKDIFVLNFTLTYEIDNNVTIFGSCSSKGILSMPGTLGQDTDYTLYYGVNQPKRCPLTDKNDKFSTGSEQLVKQGLYLYIENLNRMQHKHGDGIYLYSDGTNFPRDSIRIRLMAPVIAYSDPVKILSIKHDSIDTAICYNAREYKYKDTAPNLPYNTISDTSYLEYNDYNKLCVYYKNSNTILYLWHNKPATTKSLLYTDMSTQSTDLIVTTFDEILKYNLNNLGDNPIIIGKLGTNDIGTKIQNNAVLSNRVLFELGKEYKYSDNKTALPIAYAQYVGDSIKRNYIYYVTNEGKVFSSRISEDTPIDIWVSNSKEINVNHIVPTAITKLNAYYFAKDNKLYISAQGSEVPTGKFKWYFPKKQTEPFVNNITNLHPISKDDVAIFFDDHINYVHRETSEDKTLYYYYTSKIQLGCRLGNTILTTFDGKYIVFATKRGIVALSYQNFVATDEQTLTYLSDNIFAIYDKWNISAIKLLQYKYWIICYRQDNETAYVYDLRNNSWWPITYDISTKIFVFKNKLHIVSDNDIFVLDTAYNNYKDTKGNISWKIKSQKLHFNALNYYKHINNITLNNVADDGVCTMTLKLKAYRKVMNESKDLVFDIPINFIRTFVKHLSILKTNEFQYQLTSDDTVALNSPLRLSNITIKYKITGQVR